MADATAIANMALGRIKVGRRITSLAEQSSEAKTCGFWMSECRRAVLRSMPWAVAQRAVSLAQIEGQEFPGWSYVYAYPTDALKVNFVSDDSGMRLSYRTNVATEQLISTYPQSTGVPWLLANSSDGQRRVILCDLTDAWAFYTADVTDFSVFPQDLASAIAWELAAEIGGSLGAADTAINAARTMAEMAKAGARAQSLNEERPDKTPESPSISCRY